MQPNVLLGTAPPSVLQSHGQPMLPAIMTANTDAIIADLSFISLSPFSG